ncbi:hypothetical protein BGZ52_010378 [Haplosporangium bisporale]|nr:hypothetical protein BGZ52_010378 [Haplosporangium bisporale]KAF9202901.1 hypothetical protein BGZ59_001918 [Podila verticillata]
MTSPQPWKFDFASTAAQVANDSSKRYADPPGYVGSKDIAAKGHKGGKSMEVDQELLKVKASGGPMFFTHPTQMDDGKQEIFTDTLKAWDVALAPGKQLPMQAFMLWMSGNSVQIFSVAITAMLMFSPIKALFSMSQVFERYETVSPVKVHFTDSKLALPKVTFIAMQILTILLGMWKLNAMGLLPTSHSDWLAFLDPKTPIEYAA